MLDFSAIVNGSAGRQLSTFNIGYGTITGNFNYNDQGIRTYKTVTNSGGTTNIEYQLNGSNVTYEKRTVGSATKESYYAYDSNGDLYAFNYSDSANSSLNGWYTYKKNIQGDILGIVDSAGNEVVSYKYNAWGKILSTTGTKASTIGAYNEYLYRGYRYDRDLNLYYLQSRFYDSETCRFINADDVNVLLEVQGDLSGINMFSYCSNNPVNYVDENGYFWVALVRIIVVVVVAIVKVIAKAITKVAPKIVKYAPKIAQYGTNFGKLGTLVKNPGIKVAWNKLTDYGLKRMTERDVTKAMVELWVKNGKALEQSGGKYLFVTKEGAAVLDKAGKLVTAYTKSYFDTSMQSIIKQLFG